MVQWHLSLSPSIFVSPTGLGSVFKGAISSWFLEFEGGWSGGFGGYVSSPEREVVEACFKAGFRGFGKHVSRVETLELWDSEGSNKGERERAGEASLGVIGPLLIGEVWLGATSYRARGSSDEGGYGLYGRGKLAGEKELG
ncbi:unnamed protein product [Dovyalis caffra]|uniref:Uncharacterized protein n=1 Tax=Dovyalis caffra TaxID=77055 RepID=A0AAV1RF74_9ROSI|nr:unnamed protein product [Dovyalis caffra]